MSDVYYILITVFFCVFVLLMMWWVYRYLSAANPLRMTHDELSDPQKEIIYNFCSEMRRGREAREAKEAKEAEALQKSMEAGIEKSDLKKKKLKSAK